MINADYDALTVTGDMTAKFKSKDEMFKAVKSYVVMVGKGIPRETRRGVRVDDGPFVFKHRTNEGGR